MAPEPGHESEEEQVPLDPASGEPASSDLGPPRGTPRDTVAPSRAQDTKPHSTLLGSANSQLFPETLDPRTVRLLWEQRELEIQALRWAVYSGQQACHILQEVAGIPSERSPSSQNRVLQNQVQKLTLELKAQKEQAQLEKERLEEQLAQTQGRLQQLEAQLQTFQESCLLQLARSSWVGRMLRSQTGSVEVVTAETLMDPSDFSENDPAPTPREGFRLEDVDWNSVALRYPNLLASIHSASEQKQPHSRPPPLLDTWSSDSPGKHLERPGKSLEWSSLPSMVTSSSGGADSDSSSCQLVLHSQVQKVIGRPPQAADLASSEQIQAQTVYFNRDTEGLVKTDSQPLSKTILEPSADLEPQYSGHQLSSSLDGCCLKIVAVSRRERSIRVLNQSLEETVDLSGFALQQLLGDFPVSMYRFLPGTLLAPRHHITVWGEEIRSTRKQAFVSSGQDSFHSHCGRRCVTRLLNPKGQVLSEHQSPHCVTPGSKVFTDNTDWSIDRFPLSETGQGVDTSEQPRRPLSARKGRVRVTGARRRRPRTLGSLPLLSTHKPIFSAEVPERPAKTETSELLPPIPKAGLCLPECPARKEHEVRVCRKRVDRRCPMVALSVQSSAESRYGFRFLSCPPITVDVCRRI